MGCIIGFGLKGGFRIKERGYYCHASACIYVISKDTALEEIFTCQNML